jgi:ABC-type multidrug transport system ATPase subunit
MLQLIREMKQDHGMSVVLCSHLLSDVEQVCDEVVILKAGQVVHHTDLEAERHQNRRFVELEVTGDPHGFAGSLRAIGADGITEGEGRWRIVLPPGVELREIWKICARHELSVRKLTHRRDTLEEIFLKAVGHLQASPAVPEAPKEEVTHGRL